MKKLRLACLALSAATLAPYLTSCISDRNPFDVAVVNEKETAKIRLVLDAASTRADNDLSTDEEKIISKVNVFVFDDFGALEKIETNVSVSSESPAVLEVTPGNKTVYAVSAKSVVGSTVDVGATMTEFENVVFSSTVNDLKTNDGFVMIGKSGSQQVFKSMDASEIPASNIFNIELVRLLAKTQVKFDNVDASGFGFKIGNAHYRVCQTSDKMRLKYNGTDVFESYGKNDGGTYEGYSKGGVNDNKLVVKGAFTAADCQYVPENIVKNPVSGNTTFVILSVNLIPLSFYEYYVELTSSANTEQNALSFYAVALVDEENGFEDFVIDPSNKHVIVFKSSADADRYINALNGGQASAITVSEAENPMKAAAAKAQDGGTRQFQKVFFTGGMAYYRINISDSEGALKVERNKFYKIAVNSIKNLGFHDLNLLRPKNPESDPGHSTSAWIESVLTVAKWDEVDQDVDL
ncbi:MAG: fimbria major subunit [Bacteroides sp.]|nr:fimbria major subunit [Bacteroides sp.]